MNAGAEQAATGRAETKPMIISYDPAGRSFSQAAPLGPADDDHHYAPVIWSDTDGYIHVLYGCHKTPGTHLVSKRPGAIGRNRAEWDVGPQIAPGISYPTFHRVLHDKVLMYYRNAGHIGSWTYRISGDNGKTWAGPGRDVIDLDSKGRFEWSSYQTCLPGPDGRYLHVAFVAYDDNRQDETERYYNPRYNTTVGDGWKYNLYYVQIDLETGVVSNYKGVALQTPVDLDQANEMCRIWDTEWRATGLPPGIALDEKGQPVFLHVLSGETTRKLQYHFMRLVEGAWVHSVVAPANHHWNCGHIRSLGGSKYQAFLVTGDEYPDAGGYMDKHGGGRIEQWATEDGGATWQMVRDLTPPQPEYAGWKFNNIQPVVTPAGTEVPNMLLFYGWKDGNTADARGFLLKDL
jgi:hypothetical protein